jgi:hypothetical protein
MPPRILTSIQNPKSTIFSFILSSASCYEKSCERDHSIAYGLEFLCKVEPPKPRKRAAQKLAVEKSKDEEPELIEESRNITSVRLREEMG